MASMVNKTEYYCNLVNWYAGKTSERKLPFLIKSWYWKSDLLLNKSCVYIVHVFCQASLLVPHLEWHAHYLLECSSLRLREYERRNNNRGIFFGKEEMREYQVCLSFASPNHWEISKKKKKKKKKISHILGTVWF